MIIRIALIFLLIPCLLQAQSNEISGNLVDKGTKEPVPFAHVYFKGTQQGTTTDINGDFVFRLKTASLPSDTIIFSSLGYKIKKIHAVIGQNFKIELEPELLMIDEVVFTAEDNPAIPMMRKIIAKKEANNPYNNESYTSQEYSKIRFDLNHFTEKIKENALLKPFDYIWDNVDTTSDGVTYLPILLEERISNHYYRKSPGKEKSVITAKKVTGLPGPKIMEFVEDLYFTPNIYDDYVVILDKNFPSPLNSSFRLHYDYYLDSSGVGLNKQYDIIFQPKLKRELAFSGEMSIDSASYAVKHVSLRFDIMANVNFVRSYLVEQKYSTVSGTWMLSESNVIGDFTVIENSEDLTGFFGRKNSSFSNYTINTPIPSEKLSGIEVVSIEDNAEMRTDQFWSNQRIDSLSSHEVSLKNMMTRLEADPKFIFRKDLLVGIATGYVPIKQLNLGDFYSFYSYNYVEESRVKLGFRTSRKSSFPLTGSAYVVYGFNDEKYKYGIDAQYRLNKKNTTRIGGNVTDDIIQLGRSFNAIAIDHVLSSLVQIGDVASRVYAKDYSAYFEQTLFPGLVGRVTYFNSTLSPTDTVTFRSLNDNGIVQTDQEYVATGLDFTLKFNWQNKNLIGEYYNKEDLKKNFRKFPDLTIQYKYADETFGSGLNFQKLRASLNQQLRTINLGYFKYYVEVGKTYGTVPYTFLDTPFSNQLVLNDDFAFNLMNYLEFAADEYIMANVQHHFDGAILDKIPLLNRLKWRSFIFAKGYWGSLSDENYNAKYLFLDNISQLNEPYYEVGFGIENIFKIARIDFTWRLNNTTLPDTYNFIVKPSFSLSF